VATRALQGVTLRPVLSQEGVIADEEETPRRSNHDDARLLRNDDSSHAKLRGRVASTADQRSSVPQLTNNETPQDFNGPEKTDVSAPPASPDGARVRNHGNTSIQHPLVTDQVLAGAKLTAATKKQGNADSWSRSLSETRPQSPREWRPRPLDSEEDTETNDKKNPHMCHDAAEDSSALREVEEVCGRRGSPEEPTLCIVGLMASPEDLRGRRSSPGLNSQSQLPADSSCTPLPSDMPSPNHLAPTTSPGGSDPPVGSPQRQKPPDRSPQSTEPPSGTRGTARAGTTSNSTMGAMGMSGNSGPSGIIGTTETRGRRGTWNPLDETTSTKNRGTTRGPVETWTTLATTPPGVIQTTGLPQDAEKTLQTNMMSSLLSEEEGEDEKETVEQRGMKTSMMPSTTGGKDKTRRRKRRKRRAGSHLLMVSTIRPSPSSSSSSSSGDEQDVKEGSSQKARMATPCDQDSRDCENSCALIGRRSTNSLRGKTQDLLIHEEEEEEEEERSQKGTDKRGGARGALNRKFTVS